jgi:hypothetical protein
VGGGIPVPKDRLPEALDLLEGAAGAPVATVLEAAELNEARRRTGAGHLDRLRRELSADGLDELPIITVPELFVRSHGPRVVTLVAEALSAELDVEVAG